MLWLLALLAVSLSGELLLTNKRFWPARKLIAVASLVILSFACAGLLVVQLDALTISLAIIGAYRAFNLARVMEDRMHEQFARHAVRQSAVWLGSIQAFLAIMSLLIANGAVAYSLASTAYSLAVVQVMAVLLLLWSFKRQMLTTAMDSDVAAISDSKLPSVTVAIPARNEDTQLEACLTSVLASNYPKLEVIVLDDCSADRTPEIIRSFAHAGVRFIRGGEPTEGWLPKNQAYDRLFTESSGPLVLFCGVDIRFDHSSIRQLVTTMQHRNKTMLSVLPQSHSLGRLPLLQAMRYYWEMIPPRRLFNRPPVLSSCWLITKSSLRQAGGFSSVRHTITPEAHFARDAIKTDGYSFIRSDGHLSVTSDKPAAEQTATAIQTRYPQLHRRPELVAVVALTEFSLLVAPIIVVLYGIIMQNLVLFILPVTVLIIHAYVFGKLQQTVFPNAGKSVYVTFLPAIVTDIMMLHYSMYRYEFSEVYWKGRNICYPVMHVVPHLPKLR